jgi:protein-S-isoprenylcysteine O-methyltransferase Ste14
VSTKLKTLVQLLVVGVGISLVLYEIHPAVWAFGNVVGVALAIAAYLLWVTARLQLGDSFSVTAQARQLVTHGLYSKIRNPVYVFGTLFIVGVALAINRPLLLLALPVILPMQVIRARAEAKVLEDKFGDAYREYRRNTWF